MKAAVLGSPIAHSLSPVLHRAAYDATGLTGWTYEAIECDEAGLPALVAQCGADWAGLSLTMPLKRAILPLLDHVDPLAADVGGANTVVFSGGRRYGYNTDVAGMVAALAAAGLTAPRSAVILGAGATACSALAALRETGLRAVTVEARDETRAAGLLAVARRLGVRVDLRPLGSTGGLAGKDLLISTVPAGAADSYPLWTYAGGIPHVVSPRVVSPRVVSPRVVSPRVVSPRVVFDVVYAPWPTPLARAAAAAGAVVIGGFDLLLHQAGGQFELMTGRRPAPLGAMRAAGLAELDRRAAGVVPS